MVLLVVDTEYSSLLAARAQHFLYCLDNMRTHLYIQTYISTQLIRIWFVCHTQKTAQTGIFHVFILLPNKSKKAAKQRYDQHASHCRHYLQSHVSFKERQRQKKHLYYSCHPDSLAHQVLSHSSHRIPRVSDCCLFSCFYVSYIICSHFFTT